MGTRTVNFFMSESDEREFAELVLTRPETSFVRDTRYTSPQFEEYTSVNEFLEQPVREYFNKMPLWYIWCKDLASKTLKYRITGLAKEYYMVNHAENHILYFERSVTEGNIISQGELSGQTEAWLDADYVSVHDERLIKYYDKLARWIRKKGVKATYDGESVLTNTFILPGALKFFHIGGTLGPWTDKYINFFNQSYKPIGYKVDEKDTIKWRWDQRP